MVRTENLVSRQTYRVAEVSRILGVPRATVYRWIAEGNLPSIRVGRVLLLLPFVDRQAARRHEQAEHPADQLQRRTQLCVDYPGRVELEQ